MNTSILDVESILSRSEQWIQLDQKWGQPVDLDKEDVAEEKSTSDGTPAKKIFVGEPSLISDYEGFLRNLDQEVPKEMPQKQFYFVNGQILSAVSVEDICDKIDDIFKSVDNLCAATSTMRRRKPPPPPPRVPDVVYCSMSCEGLSFDDTVVSEEEGEQPESVDADKFIEEAFDRLHSTLAGLSEGLSAAAVRDSVTALVQRFTAALSERRHCSPRRSRQCSDRFNELVRFWTTKAHMQ